MQRQEVVKYFIENDISYWKEFFNKVKQFGDLDKKIHKLSSYSGIKKGRSIILFEKNVEFKKLEEMKNLSDNIFFISDFFKENSNISKFSDTKLSYIKNLLEVDNKIYCLYDKIMNNFHDNDILRIKGFLDFDNILEQIKEIDDEFDAYIIKKNKKYNYNFMYVEFKEKKEFEIHNRYSRKINENKFKFLTKKKDLKRYSTIKLDNLK